MFNFSCNKTNSDAEEKVCLTEATEEDQNDDDDKTEIDKSEEISQEQKPQSSILQTSFNILNLIQGMGTLGIPYAIKVGGLSSIIYIVIIAVVTCYTGGLIIEAQYDDGFDEDDKEGKEKSKPRVGYAAVGEAVWTTRGSRIVSTVQLVHLFGACVLYLILVSNFLESVFPEILLTKKHCMILAGVLVFPTAFLSNLSNIAWLSLTSVTSLNIVFVLLIGYSVSEYREWRITSLHMGSMDGMVISICIILFSYVAHPYLPKIEGNMKEPGKFKFVTNVAFTMATMTKIVFGVALACHYGDKTKQRVTNNVRSRSLKLIIDALLALSGLFSFAMPLNVILNIIEKADLQLLANIFPLFRKNRPMSCSERSIDLAMRIILVCMSTTVAMLIPEFSLLMAIFGSVTAVGLVILFPIHFHAQLFRDKMTKQSLILSYLLVAVFVAIGATGLASSLKALVQAIRTSDE